MVTILRRYSQLEAEDVLQEAALAMLLRMPQFDTFEHFLGYLRKRVRGIAIDKLTSQRELLTDLEQVESKPSSAEQELFQDEAMGELRKRIARLPPQQRAVMSHAADGLPIHEIARRLAMTEATVRSTLRHARERLDREMQQWEASYQ